MAAESGDALMRADQRAPEEGFSNMADDAVQDLMNARTALINERRNRARLLAIPGARTDEVIQSFFAIQQTLEAINRAITDERKRKPAARRAGF